MAREILIGLISTGLAALVVSVLHRRLLVPLDIHTGVIGFPTFAAFNPYPFEETFYLAAVGGPALAMAIFWLLTSAGRRLGVSLPERGPLLPVGRRRTDAGASAAVDGRQGDRAGALDVVAAAARLVVPGAVLGVGLAILRNSSGSGFWALLALTTASYAALVAVAAAVVTAARRHAPGSLLTMVGRVNAVLACATVMSLWAASYATQVTTLDDGAVHPYSWLPLPVAVMVSAAVAALALLGLWRAGDDMRRVRSVERLVVLVVALPVLVFLGKSMLVGTQIWLNTFESGQQLVSVRLIGSGAFPWRDFVSLHGLTEDTLGPLLGMRVLQDSYWGASAGVALLWYPAIYVTFSWLAYKVSKGSWAVCIAAAVLLFGPGLDTPDVRFFLWPLILVLLAVALERRSWLLGAGVGAGVGALAVTTPEAAFAAPACAVAVAAHDLYRADLNRGRRLASLRPTIGFVAGLAAAGAALLGLLLAAGALGGFVRYYRVAAVDHILTGAVPPLPLEPGYLAAMLAPALGVLAAAATLAVKLRSRTVLASRDFALIAAALMTVLYYQKFTSRADTPHLLQVYVISLPLLIIVVVELIDAADSLVRRAIPRLRRASSPPRLVALAVIAAAVAASPTRIDTLASTIPDHFRALAATEPSQPELGYTGVEQPLVDDLDADLRVYAPPGERIFDFDNEPGLLFYQLPYRPATPYYFIAGALTRYGQLDLLSSLQRDPPRLIVYYGPSNGHYFGIDGISNSVREYEVSRWILDHYRPLVGIDDQVILERNDLHLPAPADVHTPLRGRVLTDDLLFQVPTCDWGHAAEFLDIPHPPEPAGVDATVLSSTPEELVIAPPAGHTWAEYGWIEPDLAPASSADEFRIYDRIDAPGTRDIRFAKSEGSFPAYRFPIGACPQWHAYGDAPLHVVHHGGGAPLNRVRLLP